MDCAKKVLNLVLGGGGVKGIAFLGVFEVAEQRGYVWRNIAGVSAGSLTGSYEAAGYTSAELKKILYEFDFEKMYIDKMPESIPIVARYIEFYRKRSKYKSQSKSPESFFRSMGSEVKNSETEIDSSTSDSRIDIMKSILTFGKDGCLCDGDYLETWVYKVLADKGIKTFGDLRGGTAGKLNPNGYKIRMTAVDINRAKIITLPDDMEYYGINPDRLEVSKAVRMSTSVPFVFKPVEIRKTEGSIMKTYNIVDGGVFDNFPGWAIENDKSVPTVGFKLDGGEKKLLSISSPLHVLKVLISAVNDLGIPKNSSFNANNIAKINTSKVSSLDFNLSEEERDYLYKSGKHAAILFFNNFEQRLSSLQKLKPGLFNWK